MSKDVFRFKHFECRHARSSMKIGVDAVLVGAWADVSDARTVLDVGCGCGVIAMMCAQRSAFADVYAIDIDHASVIEADANFSASPWPSRLHARCLDFNDLDVPNMLKILDTSEVDLIISNPPYFDDGIRNPSSSRLVARHQAALNPYVLIERADELLSKSGLVAMVVPDSLFVELVRYAFDNRLSLRRAYRVKGHSDAPVKRVLLEFCREDMYEGAYGKNCHGANWSRNLDELHESMPLLTLETAPGIPTEEHRKLCADFYLKF